MSYILDALKRSQEERELGQVPTLGAAPHLDAPRTTRASPWLMITWLMAVAAMALALYALFNVQQARLVMVPTTPSPLEASTHTDAPDSTPQRIPVPKKTPLPARPQPGQRSQTISKDFIPPNPNLSMSSSRPSTPTPVPIVQRHETGATMQVSAPQTEPKSSSSNGNIPADLVAEVERFKQQVLRGRREHKTAKVSSSASVPMTAAVVPPLPPPGLEALPMKLVSQMPAHRLTVHVYGARPAQRFVILNGQRLQEGEQTPEGLLLVAIRGDGVILEFHGRRFFQHR